MRINMNKIYVLSTVFTVLLYALAPQVSHAQNIYKLNFLTQQNDALRKKIYEALDEQVDYYNKKYGIAFHLYFSFDDLNFDGKPEIFVQLNEQYEFHDKHGNVDTFVFAQTSKGLLPILHVQAQEIGIGLPDGSKLKRIYAFKAPNMDKPVPYIWNGEDKYVEE